MYEGIVEVSNVASEDAERWVVVVVVIAVSGEHDVIAARTRNTVLKTTLRIIFFFLKNRTEHTHKAVHFQTKTYDSQVTSDQTRLPLPMR